jgi:hypothetical protein
MYSRERKVRNRANTEKRSGLSRESVEGSGKISGKYNGMIPRIVCMKKGSNYFYGSDDHWHVFGGGGGGCGVVS